MSARVVFAALAALAMVLAPHLVLTVAGRLVLALPGAAVTAVHMALPLAGGAVVTILCGLTACIYLTIRSGERPQRWAA